MCIACLCYRLQLRIHSLCLCTTVRELQRNCVYPDLMQVLFHARYSNIRLDDSLGPSALQVLGQRLLVYCETQSKPLRPLLFTFLNNPSPAHAFLIEVCGHVLFVMHERAPLQCH